MDHDNAYMNYAFWALGLICAVGIPRRHFGFSLMCKSASNLDLTPLGV